MGGIYDSFKSAFRDFASDGVPASGAHEPAKSEIRQAGLVIESAIGALDLAGALVFATLAGANADLAHAAGTRAIVYNDSLADNNGVYVKLGASGSGSWLIALSYGRDLSAVADTEAAAAAAVVSATSAAGSARDAEISADNAAADAAAALSSSVTASAVRAAILDDIAGHDLGATLPLQAVSRSALAALSGMTSGRQAMLSEARRAGLFTWSAADLSDEVAADPYQGLYVAPTAATTGASGAWVRTVLDGTYQAAWWGLPDGGLTQHLRLQSMFDLIPAGAVVELPKPLPPAADAWMTIRGHVDIGKPCTVRGFGYYTGILQDPNVAAGIYGDPASQNFNMLRIGSSDVLTENFRLSGQLSNSSAANPAAIEISGIFQPNPPLSGQRVTTGSPIAISRVRVRRMLIDNCTLGIVTFGDDRAVTSAANVASIAVNTDIEISKCSIDVNYMGVEVFYSDRVRVFDNQITVTRAVSDQIFFPCIRVCGSHTVFIDRNKLKGAFETGANMYGVGVMADVWRRINADVSIHNNEIEKVCYPVNVDECSGFCSIRGNIAKNSLTNTGNTNALRVMAFDAPSSVTQKVGRLVHIGNTYEGFGSGYNLQGWIRHFESRGNTFIGNNYGSSAGDTFAIKALNFNGSIKAFVQVKGDTFIMKAAGIYRPVSGLGGVAGEYAELVGNAFGEFATSNRAIDDAGAGYIKSGAANAAVTAATVANNDNWLLPSGTWAAAVA